MMRNILAVLCLASVLLPVYSQKNVYWRDTTAHIPRSWVKPSSVSSGQLLNASGQNQAFRSVNGHTGQSMSMTSSGIPGDDYLNPIDAGTYVSSFQYSDIQNTGNFTNDYGGAAKDVVYRFTINQWMDVTVSHCGSALSSTSLYLMDSSGSEVSYGFEDAGYCPNYRQHKIRIKLPAGTWHVVSEGTPAAPSGSITTSIQGTVTAAPAPGHSFFNPIDAGTHGSSFNYADAQDTYNFDHLVFYRFTLTREMQMALYHCDTDLENSHLWLLNASGRWLNDDIDYYGGSPCDIMSYIDMSLSAGTYILVTDDDGEPGILTTYIEGVAEVPPGDTFDDPIDAGTFTSFFEYSDTRNTHEYSNSYPENATNDVFYRFTLTRGMDIEIDYTGSALSYSASSNVLFTLLDADGNIAGTNYLSEYPFRTLTPGTYYVVSEGYSVNGSIKTTIRGVTPLGDNMQKPFTVNFYNDTESQFTRTYNTSNYTNDYTGQSTSDLFFKLSISTQLDITASNCGSSLTDTYLYLLDAGGNLLASSGSAEECVVPGQAFLKRENLPAGTYYIVTEGKTGNGAIQTTVTGSKKLPGGNIEQPVLPELPAGSSSNAVGSTGLAFDVSATGAATLSVPIAVPPGTGGMQPRIAIAYNSQADNNVAGYGAGISGIPVITRGPKTIYHDGTAKGISYTGDDAYYLDGQRLVYSPGTGMPGQEGAIYYPESDPFAKVTVHGTYSGTSCNTWFEVTATDGIKYRYGKNTPSRQQLSGGRVNAWYLDYVEDPLGNYMTYTYHTYLYYVYLSQITYGKNKNEASPLENKVILNYQSRPDAVPFAAGGNRGGIHNRLSGITVWTGSSKYREYVLEYAQPDHFSRLVSVTEKNGNGEALKPTTIQWSNLPDFGQSSSTATVANVKVHPFANDVALGDQPFQAADLNGDGIADMVSVFPVRITTATWPGGSSWKDRDYAYIRWGSLDAAGNTQFITKSTYEMDGTFTHDDWINRKAGCSPIDFDGNGTFELLIPHINFNQNWKEIDFWFFSGALNNRFFGYALQHSEEMPAYAIGDMNNDGKGDVVYIEKGHSNNLYPCEIVGHNQGTVLYRAQFNLNLPAKPEKMFVSDFNGDGMNDVMIFYNGGYTIFWNRGGGISAQTLSGSDKTAGTGISNVFKIHQGDFNGDGLPDFLMNATNSAQWHFALNNGDGTFTKQQACTLEIYDHGFTGKDNDKFGCHVFDFDYDGKSDVVITKAMYDRKTNILGQEWGEFRKTHAFWMRSTGTELTQVAAATSDKESDAFERLYVTGDFNGDGHVELMNYGYDCYSSTNAPASATPVWRMYRNPGFSAQSGRVSSITSGLGNSTSITYASLVTGGIYTKGTGAAYPVMDVIPPLAAVKSATYSNGGVTGAITENHAYADMKLHTQGKGLIGMMKKTVENTTLGTVAEEGITTLNTTWFVPSETYSKTTIDSRTAETKLNFTIADRGSKKIFVYPNRKTETDLDGNINTTVYDYDTSFGYIKEEKTEYGSSSMCQTRQYGDYILAGGTYKPQLLTLIQKHADDGSPFTRKTRMQYEPAKGYPVSKIENYGSSQPLTTEYGYDAFGNQTSAKMSGNGVKPVTTHTVYDATGRFINSTYTSPSSSVATFTYDTWGNVLTETDATSPDSLLVTAHQYDGWGRKTLTVLPGGREIQYSSGWGNTANKYYYILTQPDGSPWVLTWYDRAGRETVTETVGPKGMRITGTKSYYDTGRRMGRLRQTVSVQGNLTVAETFDYDARGRLTSQSVTGGSVTAYSYGNRSETRTVDGKQHKKTYDAWGGLTESKDALNGVVTYRYHSSGQPAEITAAGAVFEMTYDAAGNQATLTDPNAGTTGYTYDAAGNLKTQTDARGTLTVIHRDRLGRDSCTVQGSMRTVYTWGTSGNNLHRLTKIETGGARAEYAYDGYGRTVTETRTVPGETPFVFTYAYNDRGQLQSTTYPGNVPVSNEYDVYGNLVKVKSGAMAIWELTGETGTLTTERLGGGAMTATTTRNASGHLASLKTIQGNTQIRNMDFVFDASTGNLTSRTGMTAQQETFEYDNLDRLTTAGAMSISYAANGNITGKTGLGEYSYGDGAGPHALTGVDDPDGLINSRTQAIEYNAFRKASVLIDTVGNDAYRLEIIYGPDGQRWKTVLQKNGNITKTVIFAGDYEKITENGVTRELIYLPGGGIYVRQAGQADKVYYTHTDHLGSIVSITDGAGAEVFKASYDAWGKQTVTLNTIGFHRGYTGHEHLPEFGLINMNGRMYDPIVGRFLSPDPYVQAPDFSQNFNRYSYALNNPLIYTDPTGEFFWLIPNIGWSKGGGFSIGLSVVVGIPGLFSTQAGVGYSFENNDLSAYAGASAAFNTAYVSASTQSGFSVGWSAGLSPFSGLPISSNLFSFGYNHNFTHNYSSINFSAWTFGQDGNITFNPSFSATIFPGRATNLIRGRGFRTNQDVLEAFADDRLSMKASERLSEKGWHDFKNEKEAYQYMWQASHKLGKGYKEHAAYVLQNGKVVLLPANKNTFNGSYTLDHLVSKNRNGTYTLLFKGTVSGYTHTHPGSTSMDISVTDRAFMNKFPNMTFKTIANGGIIYQVWGNGIYKQIGTVW